MTMCFASKLRETPLSFRLAPPAFMQAKSAAFSAAGYPIVAHIHDEVVIDMPKKKGSLDDAIRIMTQNTPWNEGLIMNADGFEGAYYKKD